MAGKNKTKASKNLSKKRNKANKKAKADALRNFETAMAGEELITQEQLQAAGDEIDNATLYTDSDFSDTSDDDVGYLEKEMEKDEMTSLDKTKQKEKETGSKSSYPNISAEFATEDFGGGHQKETGSKSIYPSVSAEFASENFGDGSQKESYPGLAANHAATIVGIGPPGEMGPPPPRASSLAAQADNFLEYLKNGVSDVLGIHPDIPGGRPLPNIPVSGQNDNVTASDAPAAERFDDMVETLLAKQATGADINALGLARLKQMEEGNAQEKEYDPAAFDLASVDREREDALFEDQMDYVMSNDHENDTSANSGNKLTPTTSEDGAPHKLVIECSSKKAADEIGSCLIAAAQDVDITRDITNVSVVSTSHGPEISERSGYVNASFGGKADQLAIDHAISSGDARHQLETFLSLASNAFKINEAGLPKPAQSSAPIDPRAEKMLEAVLDGARAKGKEKGEYNWVDAEIQTLGEDTAKRAKVLGASGGGDTLFAINDDVIDLDEAIPKPNSKKRKRLNKKKNKKKSAISENTSTFAGGADDKITGEVADVSNNAISENTSATTSGPDDTIMTGEAADDSNNDEVEYYLKEVATELVVDAALNEVTSERADIGNKDEYDFDYDWKVIARLMVEAGVKEVTSKEMEKELTAKFPVKPCDEAKAKARVGISQLRDEMQKELDQQGFVHKRVTVGEEADFATLKDLAKSDDDLAAQKRVGQETSTIGANLGRAPQSTVVSSTVPSTTIPSVDVARVEAEAIQLLTAFTPEVCQKLLLDDIENHGLVMGRAMLHIAAHGGPTESSFFQKALNVTQEEAARSMTDEEVDAKNSQIQAILTYYTILKSEENDDKKILKFKDLYVAPMSVAVDQLQKVTQELSGKVRISSKLISNVNSQVRDLVAYVKIQENELIRIKEIIRGAVGSMDESAVGFMANSCQTFSEDFKNLRALMDDRRDDMVACMKALDDTFRLHMKEHHASQHRIPDVLKEVHRVKGVFQAQLNVACQDIDSLRRRGADWDDKIQQLQIDVKLARLEVMASAGDGPAMGKVTELWVIVDGLGTHIGAANRGIMELKARVDTDFAKHDKSIGTIKSDVAGLQKTVKGNKTKIEKHSQDITNLQLANDLNVQQTAGLASKLEPAINGLNNTRQQVFRAIAEQNTIKNTLAKNGKEIGDLADVVEVLQVKQEDEHEKLKTTINKQYGRIGNLEQKVSTYDDRITATDDRIDTTTSQIIKLHNAFEREFGPIEPERDEDGSIAPIKKFQDRLLNATKSSARYEARKAVKSQMFELEQRVEQLEIATAARASLVHATVETDLPGAIAPASVNDDVPATPQDAGPRVRLPSIDRIMAEHVPITPGAPSPALMLPHPAPPGSATMPPPSMGLPTIPEDSALNVVSQPFSSPAMDRAMQAPAGSFSAPNMVNASAAPGGPIAPMLMPAMVNGVPGPFPLGGPGTNYPSLLNGAGFGDGAPPPPYPYGTGPVEGQLNHHFGFLDAIGHDLRATNARVADVDARFAEFRDTILYLPDQVRHATQDTRYEMGVKHARMEKELTERFAWLSNDYGPRLELLENALHRVENDGICRDQEQNRLEGMIFDLMKFVGMPPPASGQKRKSMEQMVIEIMDFVGMRRGFGGN